jgi:hypothetical protein
MSFALGRVERERERANPFARSSYSIPEGRSDRRAPKQFSNLWPKCCPLVDSKFTRLIFFGTFSRKNPLRWMAVPVVESNCDAFLWSVMLSMVRWLGAWWLCLLLLVLVARFNPDITYVPCVDDDSLSTAEQKTWLSERSHFVFVFFNFSKIAKVCENSGRIKIVFKLKHFETGLLRFYMNIQFIKAN